MKVWAYGLWSWEWSEDRVLGYPVRFSDGPSFVYLVEEIFMRQVYGDATDTIPERKSVWVVDCGANLGLSSLYVIHRRPEVRLVIVEPNPAAEERLRMNLSDITASRVRIHPVAVGREAKDVVLSIPSWSATSPGAYVREGDPVVGTRDVRVQCVPLSSLLPDEVALLKLDVEGAEEDVLAELSESGALPQIKHIVMEVHYDSRDPTSLSKILALLGDGGFEVGLVEIARDQGPYDRRDLLVQARK